MALAHSPLAYRPIVSCGEVHLPAGAGLRPYPLHQGASFGGVGFHPDRPSLAICRLILGAIEGRAEDHVFAIAIGADALRRNAARMIEIADHLEIKPAKDTRK